MAEYNEELDIMFMTDGDEVSMRSVGGEMTDNGAGFVVTNTDDAELSYYSREDDDNYSVELANKYLPAGYEAYCGRYAVIDWSDRRPVA